MWHVSVIWARRQQHIIIMKRYHAKSMLRFGRLALLLLALHEYIFVNGFQGTVATWATRRTIRTSSTASLFMTVESNAPTNDNDNSVETLQEKAKRLRQEVASFEESKKQVEQQKQQETAQMLQQQEDLRNRYSAILPILKPDGSIVEEQITFPPYYLNQTSRILTYQASLPLGLIIGESKDVPGALVVDEVATDGPAALVGIQVNDVIRAFTACRMQMEQPVWQLLAGGIGRPKMFRFIHGVDARVPFETHLEALSSNRMDPEQRPAILVVERKDQ
jgi:hypothetical protein